MSASRRAAAAESRDPATPSGRLLLRMPSSLHGALTEAAEREGTSLNQFITGTLSSAIGWGGDDSLKEAPHARTAADRPTDARQSRRLFILLLANALAVGLAGVAAIAILLVAWLG